MRRIIARMMASLIVLALVLSAPGQAMASIWDQTETEAVVENVEAETEAVVENVEAETEAAAKSAETETGISDALGESETEGIDYTQVTWDDVPDMGWDDPENHACVEYDAQTMTFDDGVALLAEDEQKQVKSYGIDVSSHNGDIDWQKVKAAGVDFAMIRVGGRGYGSEGTLYKDTYAQQNIEGALAAGIDVGVYFFSTALNDREALEEAQYTCSVISDYNITYPVVFDHEGYEDADYRNYGLSSETRTENAIVFLDYVESQGYTGMMYSSAGHLRDDASWGTSTLEQLYDMWVAQYWMSSVNGTMQQMTSYEEAEAKPSSYTGKYRMWQFTSEGKVDGVTSSGLDMDIEYYEDGEYVPELTSPVITSVSNVSGGVEISWEHVTAASGYYIYRKTGTEAYSRIGQVSGGLSLSYTDMTAVSGVTYTYTVSAYSGETEGIYDEEVSILYLKDPEIAGVTAVSGGIRVDWDEIGGAEGYFVYRKTNGGKWERIASVTGGDHAVYLDSVVSGGVGYTYTVRAHTSDTISAYHSQKSLTYLMEPKLIGAVNVSGGVQVTWESVTGAGGYYVYRKVSGGSWERIGQAAGGDVLSYTDKAAVSGTNYIYTAVAYAGSSRSNYNSQISVLYLQDPVVKEVKAVSGGVQVTWDAIAGAEEYRVYRRTNGGSWMRIASVTEQSSVTYKDTGVLSGTRYSYTVRACSGHAISAYQSQGGLTYLKDPTLTGVSAAEGAIVTWDEIAGAERYFVYRKSSGGSWSRIGEVQGSSNVSYTDTTVVSGNTYIYTVRACSGNDISAYKSQKQILYLSVPVLVGAEDGNGGITISWKQVTGAESYLIYRKTSSGWNRIAQISAGTTIAYTDTTAVSGTLYTYTVRAHSGSYLSAYDRTGVSAVYDLTMETYITTETINYRTGPGTGYAIAGTLSKGTRVQVAADYSVTASGYTWYRIYLNGSYYYAAANYLQKI